MTPIPQEWIKNYVDQLLAFAGKLPEGNTMRVAAMMRADHAMDLVKAWREKESREGASLEDREYGQWGEEKWPKDRQP